MIDTDISAEATWGADPLEHIGRVRSLPYDLEACFRSSLSSSGTAKWNERKATQTSSSPNAADATLSAAYSNID
jgi:hypothetical protein